MKKRKRILIVDDDKDFLLFIGDRLIAMGYDVLTATNGQEGLDLLQRQPVDGMLLELHIPVMGGLDMLAQLKNHSPFPPVIVLSAKDHRSELREAMRRGAASFLTKPIVQDELTGKCFEFFR
jgi:CheY-like chemotaxis protein